MRNNFAAFILTHNRADRVATIDTLRSHGYTGKIYLIVDTTDPSIDEYRERYGDDVLVFDKNDVAGTFDPADNFGNNRGVIYARNWNFKAAKDLGIDYFIQLDDDYDYFAYKFDENLHFKHGAIHDLDEVFDIYVDYLKSAPIKSVAFAQGGDFIGGAEGSYAKTLKPKRKVMNSFFCKTDDPFQFIGRVNEDVNTYVYFGSLGDVFLQLHQIGLNQKQTQSNAGGMTDLYLDNGTYVKSFYSVVISPSCVKVAMMGERFQRLHHRIKWKNAVPCIISESHKK